MSENYEDKVTVLYGQMKEAQNEAFQEGIKFAASFLRMSQYEKSADYLTAISEQTLYEVPARSDSHTTTSVARAIKILKGIDNKSQPILWQFYIAEDFSTDTTDLTRDEFVQLIRRVDNDRDWGFNWNYFATFADAIIAERSKN
jgi:hypothetical protein